MPRKLTHNEVIARFKEAHGDRYDYSLIRYVNSHTKVKIVCPVHGIFEQKPYSHIQGKGCARCYGNVRLTTKEFVEKARQVHGDKFDYGKAKYKGSNSKVLIRCPAGHWFRQQATHHLSGHGCFKCKNITQGISQTYTTSDFIHKSKEVHGDRYDYSLVKYTHNRKKVKIICSDHGVFKQTPADHINCSAGCPKCINFKNTRGERAIESTLSSLGVAFTREATFDDLTGRNHPLFFDFRLALPDKSIALIEYDGRQHFEPVSLFGGKKALDATQKRDATKNAYTAKNNIPLLRIPYWERDNIETIVKDWLKTLLT